MIGKYPQLDDERYMAIAFEEARHAYDDGEVPIGAVVVTPSGRIVGRGHNMTEQLDDVTAHAEMLAITAACRTLGAKYLPECTLYVTLEPCMMCAGAIGWSRVGRVVCAARDQRMGYSSGRGPLHPRTEVVYMGEKESHEQLEMLKTFFRARR